MLAIEMASRGVMYLPNFKKISTGVQEILSFRLISLNDLNVGTTDGRDL
jgi:hypothetical protein